MKKIIYKFSMLIVMMFLILACKQNEKGSSGGGGKEEDKQLTLSANELNMMVGDTITLTSSLEGVKFSSDNGSIVTVTQEGLVKAIGAGKATITCILEPKTKSNKPSPKVAHCVCKVRNLTLNLTSITIEKGNKEQLTAKVETAVPEDDKTVKFSSENVNIATVDDKGEIQAVDVGETLIIAENNGMKVRCTVIVTPPLTFEVTLNKIFVINANFTIKPPNDSVTYAVGCLTKEKYEKQKAIGDEKDPPEGIFSYDKSWYQFLAQQAGGSTTWQSVAEEQGYYKTGTYTADVLGVEYINIEDMKPETPCILYWYRIDKDSDNPTSEIFTKEFTTLPQKPSANQITTKIEEIYNNGIKAKMTTTNTDKYFVGFCYLKTLESYLPGGKAYTKGFRLKDMAARLVASAMSEAAQHDKEITLHSGNKTITPDDIKTPSGTQKEFYFVYFPCDLENGITDNIKYNKFKLTDKEY